MPLIVIFTRAAREPAHNNGCGPVPKKCWTPVERLDFLKNLNRILTSRKELAWETYVPLWSLDK
jgi:hypothetical protein